MTTGDQARRIRQQLVCEYCGLYLLSADDLAFGKRESFLLSLLRRYGPIHSAYRPSRYAIVYGQL